MTVLYKLDKPLPLLPAFPTVIVGAANRGRVNFMTAGNCCTVDYDPPVMMVSLLSGGYTAGMIGDVGCFSICVPDVTLMEQAARCGSVSGRDTDKSAVFKYALSPGLGVPMIDACPVCMELRVINTCVTGSMTQFFGRVEATYALDGMVNGDKPGTLRINPLLCSLDGGFYRIGEKL